MNLKRLRSVMGFVIQEPILFDTSIRDNISYGAVALQDSIPFEQIKKAAEISNIHNFIISLPDVSRGVYRSNLYTRSLLLLSWFFFTEVRYNG